MSDETPNRHQKNYNPSLVKLPLHEILLANGYFYDREKTSRNNPVLKNESGDKVVISQMPNGDFLYFNPGEPSDKGNIYNFSKNRGILAQDLVKNANMRAQGDQDNSQQFSPHFYQNKAQDEAKIKEATENFNKMPEAGLNNHFCLQREISPNLFTAFSKIKQDERGNVVIPTYTAQKYTNADPTKIKVSNMMIKQTGYTSYLRNPITKDPQGIPYEKPIKQLTKGIKGVEILNRVRSYKDIKNVVIAESIIDALSLTQMKDYDLNSTMITSTNGTITKNQIAVYKELERNNKKINFILAFDNDRNGEKFTQMAQENLKNTTIEKPILKDFNDDFRVGRQLKLKINFNKKDLIKNVMELDKNINRFNTNEKTLTQKENIEKIYIYKNIREKIANFIDIKNIENSYQTFIKTFQLKQETQKNSQQISQKNTIKNSIKR